MDISMDLTIAISESARLHWGKWSASMVASTDLDAGDEHILERLVGYGETPLAAAANLLVMAQRESERREN